MTKPAPIAEAEIHGFVDGELDDARRLAVKDWLATHPDDAARVADYRALGERWREAYAPVLDEPVPAELLAALKRPRAPRWRQFAWAAAASVVATLIALAAWTLLEPHHLPGNAAAEMVERAAMAHATYAAEVHHPVDASARSKEELLAWLSQRLRMKVEAPKLDAAGFSFIGGRLLPGERAPAAMLMYEGADGRRVTLYWGPEFRQARESGLRYAQSAHGERVYYWLDDECGYALASSDVGEQQLQRLALLAHEQLEK
jgi:anti-sigma factor RsiW